MTVTLPAACPALGWGRESGLQCWADRLTEYGVDRCNRRPTRFSDIGLCNRHARLLLGHTSPVAEPPADPGPVSARLRAGISTPFEVDPGSVSTIAPARAGRMGNPGSATSPTNRKAAALLPQPAA